MLPDAILCDQVTIEPYLGDGAEGPTFGTATSVAGRLEPRREVVRRTDGTEVVSRGVLFLQPDAAVAAEDRITCDGQTYRVLTICERKAYRLPHHLEVMLG